jgi:hypothetical protein
MNDITYEYVTELLAESVLIALDETWRGICRDDLERGWIDSDLNKILPTIIEHADRLIMRYDERRVVLKKVTQHN